MPKKVERASTGVADLFRVAGQQAMAIAENAAVQGSELATTIEGRSTRIFNVLQYAEAPWGLGMSLFPVQRFIVKLYYNLPLDDKNRTIEVTDRFKERVLYHFTEKEYLQYLYAEGRCNINEQDHDRRTLILPVGRRSGKCLSGDTLVLTDQGIRRIEELGEADDDSFSPLVVGVTQESYRRARSAAFYNGGVKPTFSVRTVDGYSVEGTSNHRVKVLTESGTVDWKYLDEMVPGDFIAVNRTTDLWPSERVLLTPFWNKRGYKEVQFPLHLDLDLANLMGYLVGDGSWGDDHAVSITVEHGETWEYLKGKYTSLFGGYRVQMDTRTANTGRLEFCSVAWRQFLSDLGWELGCSRDQKMVPWTILQSPKSVVCAFLRGLFETDGGVESQGSRVTFSSASFRLAHEVQVLLLNLGIVSSVRKKWNRVVKKHYAILAIKGVRSRQLYADLIGFDSDKKMSPLLAGLERAQEGKSNTESVPHQEKPLRNLLGLIPKRNHFAGDRGWHRMRLREVMGNVIKPSCKEDVTYTRIHKILGVAKELGLTGKEVQHFEHLLELDYFYSKVESVDRSEQQVYDLTVPDGASFVANGFTNHNTTLSAVFASYELYRLVSLHNPQEYYGLPNGNRIQIISVATDKDQAGLLFNEVTAHLAKCEFFKQYISNNTLSYVNFQTPYDIEKYGRSVRHENGKFTTTNGKASLRVTFKASVSKGLRGSGNIMVIMDEMAHFQETGTSSAKDIYDAVEPSTLAFSPKDPADKQIPIGEVQSRIICISSPYTRTGKFYDLFHFAMSKAEGSEGMLAIQAPTWEVNTTVPSSFLREKYHSDPTVFDTEYGAQFTDRRRGWIEREQDLLDCVEPERRPRSFGIPRHPYQMGIDVGLVSDGSSVAITHLDGDKVVLDYHEVWYAGRSWREVNPHLVAPVVDYAKTLDGLDRLDFDEIADWIYTLSKKFSISGGLFDRWNGLPLEQNLHKRGLRQFRSEFFPRDVTSKMYQSTKLLMFDRRLALYDFPITQSNQTVRHSPFIAELLTLQQTQYAKNQIVVEAPQTSGFHDDMSDAFVRSVWLSLERFSNMKITVPSRLRSPGDGGYHGMTPGRYQRMRQRTHGILTDRMVPGRFRRR